MHAELKNIGFVSQLDFAKMKWEEVKADPKKVNQSLGG